MTMTAHQHACALRAGIGNVCLDLLKRGFVDQRALRDTFRKTVADPDTADRNGELRSERIVDPGWDVETVGAHAILPRVAVLRRKRAFDRRVEISVVEDDERRVAAEFE